MDSVNRGVSDGLLILYLSVYSVYSVVVCFSFQGAVEVPWHGGFLDGTDALRKE